MKQENKPKLLYIFIAAVFILFFSNDFGLIDVEKTSIITAIAIDKEDDEFLLTAQIAVPEATDANTENLKTQLSGKGSTVGAALKDLGDISGWFPKLAFCNLILLGNSLSQDNVIECLDYFAKTLRIQDSALVAISEKSAKELLSVSTPLDNISSFALQKIMFKAQGFDKDVATTDIKSFCSGHYSKSGCAFMPIVKTLESASEEGKSNSGGGGGSSGGSGAQNGSKGGEQNQQNKLFDTRTTALFKKGFMVGILDENQTLVFNALNVGFSGTSLPVNDVMDDNGQKSDYLLTIISCKPNLKVKASENEINLDVALKLYCKISDHAIDGSTEALSQNTPLPKQLKYKTEQMLESWLNDLIETQKQTECDVLGIAEKLYRYNHKYYKKYKDNYLNVLKANVKVTVDGQK